MKSSDTMRPLVIAAVMTSQSMVAFEATIVSTAMPQIVSSLGGLNYYTWVFSAYLLTQSVTTIIFGKLVDVLGRRPVVLLGIGIFAIASLCAGFSNSLLTLVIFRALQGVGAGALQPAGLTIVADLYPGKERGKIQGYLASIWALSAVVGPLLGGVLVRNVSWSWIFWINLPAAVLASLAYLLFLRPAAGRGGHVDIPGSLLFSMAAGSLMLGLTEGASSWRFALACLAVFACSLGLFLAQQKRTSDPLLPLAFWRGRTTMTINGITFLAAMTLVGLTTFVPIYVQGVLGQSPVVAGFALTAMMVGWPVASTVGARLHHRVGGRAIMLVGNALLPLGAAVLCVLSPGSPVALVAAASLVMGTGMGLISVTAILALQQSVEGAARGQATASNLFSRNLGSSIGAAVYGALLNLQLATVPRGDLVAEQLDGLLATTGGTAQAGLAQLLDAVVHPVFLTMLVFAMAGVAVSLLVPRITHAAA